MAKKISGWVCWALAFLVPARFALLESETVSNIPGLIAFVSFVFLVFLGYYLVDSSGDKKESHGH
jgi:hypothetical protein